LPNDQLVATNIGELYPASDSINNVPGLRLQNLWYILFLEFVLIAP
jgi:hypothetical protein